MDGSGYNGVKKDESEVRQTKKKKRKESSNKCDNRHGVVFLRRHMTENNLKSAPLYARRGTHKTFAVKSVDRAKKKRNLFFLGVIAEKNSFSLNNNNQGGSRSK